MVIINSRQQRLGANGSGLLCCWQEFIRPRSALRADLRAQRKRFGTTTHSTHTVGSESILRRHRP